MTSIERTAYPLFERNASTGELVKLYTPTKREAELAKAATRGESFLLGFLVMLKSFQRLGHFPKSEEVPGAVVAHLRSRLRLGPEASAVPPPRSRARYREVIRHYLGVQSYGDEARRSATEAAAEAALTMDDPADPINVAIEELVRQRYELPAFTALDRLARHVRHAVNSRLFGRIDELLVPRERRRLDALLEADRGGRSDLTLLKAQPKSPTAGNLGELQQRLLWLVSLGDTERLLEGITNQKVTHLAAQARALDAAELKGVGPEKRRAMVVCLIHRAKVGARDGLAEMPVKILGRVHNRGKEELERIHRERRASTEAMIELLGNILAGAAESEGNDAALGRRVREAPERDGGPELLLERYRALSEHKGGNCLPSMWRFYKGRRATLFRVVRSLVLRPTTEDRSLVEALGFVLKNEHRRGEFVPSVLDLSFASERWRELVRAEVNGEPLLARRYLEVCVFSHVAGELKTDDLCVSGSERYADYRDQLLSWEECEALVGEHCAELGLPPTPDGFVKQLKDLLSGTARDVDRSYPENSSVVIAEDGELVLKKAPTKKPSRPAKALEAAITGRLPERNLTDVVCSGEHRTGWTRHLGPLSGSEPKPANARERYVVTAFGYGTNMGPAPRRRDTPGGWSAPTSSATSTVATSAPASSRPP